jgi:hypothetical protein
MYSTIKVRNGIQATPQGRYLCQTRSVFPFQRNDTQVECLLPLRAVSSSRSHLEYIIVRSLADENAPLTVMRAALVRDCLRGADRERLDAACGRPCWRVKTKRVFLCTAFKSQVDVEHYPGNFNRQLTGPKRTERPYAIHCTSQPWKWAASG